MPGHHVPDLGDALARLLQPSGGEAVHPAPAAPGGLGGGPARLLRLSAEAVPGGLGLRLPVGADGPGLGLGFLLFGLLLGRHGLINILLPGLGLPAPLELFGVAPAFHVSSLFDRVLGPAAVVRALHGCPSCCASGFRLSCRPVTKETQRVTKQLQPYLTLICPSSQALIFRPLDKAADLWGISCCVLAVSGERGHILWCTWQNLQKLPLIFALLPSPLDRASRFRYNRCNRIVNGMSQGRWMHFPAVMWRMKALPVPRT